MKKFNYCRLFLVGIVLVLVLSGCQSYYWKFAWRHYFFHIDAFEKSELSPREKLESDDFKTGKIADVYLRPLMNERGNPNPILLEFGIYSKDPDLHFSVSAVEILDTDTEQTVFYYDDTVAYYWNPPSDSDDDAIYSALLQFDDDIVNLDKEFLESVDYFLLRITVCDIETEEDIGTIDYMVRLVKATNYGPWFIFQ
ncbi:MAG: lipoprotein [Christensenellaceae bacterium]|jgi:hypothetical protein|nr:lipoprotein [Christensenellaceae bacterium]